MILKFIYPEVYKKEPNPPKTPITRSWSKVGAWQIT